VREQFLLDPEVVFLNHGSYGACPRPVFERYQAWQLELEREPVQFLSHRIGDLLADARAVLASHVGARADDLTFVPNATTGVNVAAHALRLGADDEVLSTDLEYGACDLTWDRICRDAGARYVRAPISLPLVNVADELFACRTERTRAVYVSHITSETGLLLPVEEIVARARAEGLITIVDGAHAPGQVPLDLESLGADFYSGNCHKWLCAPKGSGFLYARADRRAELHPVTISHGYGGGFTTEVDWTGTMDPSAYLSLPAAIGFFEKLGGAAFRERNRKLAAEAATLLAGALKTEVGALPEMAGSMGLVRLPIVLESKRSEAVRVRQALQAAGTDAPVHPVGGAMWLRLSAYAYNEIGDYRRLADLLPAVLRRLGD